MEGNYQGENDGYAGEVLGHLEQIMSEQNAGDEYFDEPGPEYQPEPAYDQREADQEALAYDILQRHPVLADSDAADRLLAEARGQAEKLGIPELSGDVRFLGHVADQLGDAAFLSPFEQIQAAGSEGLGKGVLDFRQD
jgi:hypothetical protein